MKKIGIVIVVIGIVITVFTTSNIFTEEKVVEIGKMEITRDKKVKLDWSPWAGVAVMVLGAAVYIYGTKKQ